MQVLKFIEEKPRIIFFMGENMVAIEVLKFLVDRSEEVVKVIFEKDKIDADLISSFNPDVMITCYWPFILQPEIFNIPKYGCINFHPALLPRNRGWYPAVWSVLEGGITGVTLHLIDEGADTGSILAQMEFPVLETDTGGSIYVESQIHMIALFKETWLRLFQSGVILKEQNKYDMSYHTKKQGNMINEILLEGEYTADRLFKILKAKTFGDKSYAYYMKDGVKYRVHLTVTRE